MLDPSCFHPYNGKKWVRPIRGVHWMKSNPNLTPFKIDQITLTWTRWSSVLPNLHNPSKLRSKLSKIWAEIQLTLETHLPYYQILTFYMITQLEVLGLWHHLLCAYVWKHESPRSNDQSTIQEIENHTNFTWFGKLACVHEKEHFSPLSPTWF